MQAHSKKVVNECFIDLCLFGLAFIFSKCTSKKGKGMCRNLEVKQPTYFTWPDFRIWSTQNQFYAFIRYH